MIIEIDQSGKIENTNKSTVLAFSTQNNLNHSLIISSKNKKILQKYFREKFKPRMYIYETFAALVFILVNKHLKNNRFIIDREYFGNEGILKSLILEIFHHHKFQLSKYDIFFNQIGKNSYAHKVAIRAYRTKKADLRVSAGDVMKIIKFRNQKTGSKMDT